jgi:hypothetical protein
MSILFPPMIAALGLFAFLVAAAIWTRIALCNEPVPTKKPHPIRLTLLMLLGAGLAWSIGGVDGGRGQDVPNYWQRATPLICVTSGAIGGIATELIVRWGQRD